ncbi:MAG: hypothetical protein KME29_20670 [Calothrix sp. FI2-JRJ7]|nr:hypothetical protein [Calothrix sp. FI2-JRJ7]
MIFWGRFNDPRLKALKAKKPKVVDGSGILVKIGAVLIISRRPLPEKVPRSSSSPPMVFCAQIPKPAKEFLLLTIKNNSCESHESHMTLVTAF